jgi:plastocyanin
MIRRSAALAALGIAGAGLVACGGGSGAAAKSSAPASTPTAVAAAIKHGHQIVPIKGFAFRPARLVVKRGTRITWVDKDSANHTVSFKRGPGDLGNLDQGQRRSARFAKRGTYRYVCQYHPNMKGVVVVR